MDGLCCTIYHVLLLSVVLHSWTIFVIPFTMPLYIPLPLRMLFLDAYTVVVLFTNLLTTLRSST